jgi:hypothetical protein
MAALRGINDIKGQPFCALQKIKRGLEFNSLG